MEKTQDQRQNSGVRNQHKKSVYQKPAQQPLNLVGGVRLTAKEEKWVWECQYDWNRSEYVAVHRLNGEQKFLGISQEGSDRAHRIVQGMNLAITR